MGNAYREINLAPDDPDPHVDVQLHSLNRYPIRLVDQNGDEVEGCRVTGLLPSPPLANRQHITNLPPVDSGMMDVVGLEVESPRYLAVYHNKRKIGAIVELRPQDFKGDKPREITLQPVGEIKGQLVDADGKPVVDRYVYGSVVVKDHKIKLLGMDRPPFRMSTESVKTDSEGKFSIHHYVFPNVAYVVRPSRSQQSITSEVVTAGKATDVGILQLASANVGSGSKIATLRN